MSISKVEALRRTDLFGSLSEDLLNKIAELSVARQLKRGQVLYSEHDEAAAVYVVARGELRSIRQSVAGREQVLSTERPGAVLAAVPVFNGGKFYSTMIADSTSVVVSIDKRHLHALCREHSELLWNLARVLAHKVRHYAELIEILALRSVEQRLAQYLVTIARERGIPVREGCTVELTLTRSEIASRLGSVREVISRAFTHLQKSNLIRIQGRRLVNVPDLRALNTFSGTDPKFADVKLVSELSSEMA
jgi:CRP/FNR family transcriptional regulator